MRLSTPRVLLSFCSVLLSSALPARAQEWDNHWTPGSGSGFEPICIRQAANGELIVGGYGSNWNGGPGGLPYASIAKYNTSTGVYSALGSDPDANGGFVFATVEMPNGDIIATGSMTVKGVPSSLGRFNSTTGRWSPIGTGFNSEYYFGYALAVLPGGDLIVGGFFNSISGFAASNIVRYNPSTGAWSKLGTGVNGEVRALTVLTNGDLIVGGTFSEAGGISTGGVARYKPSTGAWSSLTAGGSPGTLSLAVTPSGEIVACGGGHVSRFNPTTNVWTTLGTFNADVNSVALLPGGDLVAGGYFTTVGTAPSAVSANRIARYKSSTNTWSAIGTGVDGGINCLTALPDGDIVAGGNYTVAVSGSFVTNRFLARCNPNTGVWSSMGLTSTDGEVQAMAVTPSGDVLAGGPFTKAGAVDANRVARYSPTTGLWSAFGAGIGDTPELGKFFTFYSLAELPNGDILAGLRSLVSGAGRDRLLRYSRVSGLWSVFEDNVKVTFMGFLPGGDLLVSGSFNAIGGITANNIARYNPETQTWSAIGGSANSAVTAMIALPDGDVLLGVGSINGLVTNGLTRYNPNTGACAHFSDDFSYVLANTLAFGPDGGLWMGGIFQPAPGSAPDFIVRYDLNTHAWSRFKNQPLFNHPGVRSFAFDGSDILATAYVGDYIDGGLYRFRPSTTVWSRVPIGLINYRPLILPLPDGNSVVGGKFDSNNAQLATNSQFKNFAHHKSPVAPRLTSQPASTSACRAGSASLAVKVFAAPGAVTYQWRKDGTPIDGVVNPSALSATFNLSNIQSSATYDCIATNFWGSTISNPATLSVCASDLNCDGVVEDSDFQIFVVQYNILDCADPTMPAGCAADINQDGYVDDADFQQFVVAYNQLLCN